MKLPYIVCGGFFPPTSRVRLARVHGRFKSTPHRMKITIPPQAGKTKDFLSIKSIFHESSCYLFRKIEAHFSQYSTRAFFEDHHLCTYWRFFSHFTYDILTCAWIFWIASSWDANKYFPGNAGKIISYIQQS